MQYWDMADITDIRIEAKMDFISFGRGDEDVVIDSTISSDGTIGEKVSGSV